MSSSKVLRTTSSTDTDVWVITFADLLTLLIAFFVMRYAMYTELVPPPLSKGKTFTSIENPGSSLLFEQIKNYLNQTASFRENVKNTANGIETTVVFDSIASLSTINGGAQISLDAAAIANSNEDLSFAAREILELIGKAIEKGGDLIVIRHQTSNVSDVGKSTDSGWNISSAKVAVIYRQLIDAGVKKERIFIEAFSETNPLNKGDISISVIQHDEILAKTLTRNEVLLNLTTAKPASESKITFLDL